ncbi:MAG TPA: FtsX-like permease family protein, partial [Dehalococcoidia bacterium]|nr:FtsX-like permease family protein [Dehalococcoidia bacterium]
MSSICRKAIRDLSRRKLRGLLTVAGIMIGVAGIVAIISTSQSLAEAQARAYSHASQADLSIRTSDAPDVLERQLLKLTNVAQVELRATYYTKWKAGGEWKDIYFIAFPDYGGMKLDTIELMSGSFPQKGTVVLEKSSAQVDQVPPGETILYRSYSGERLQEKTLLVSGIASSPVYLSANLFNRSIAYASLDDVRSMLGIEGNNEVKLKLVDMRQKDDTLEAVRETLGRRNLPVISVEERDPHNYPGKRELDSLVLLMLLFSILGLGISSFLVANTLAAIMGEQVSEIGVMKALGGSRWQIVRIYLMEGLIYGSVGTGLGV